MVDLCIELVDRNSLEPTEQLEMFFCSQLLPEDVELWAHSNVLSDLGDPVDAVVVDDNLQLFSWVWGDDACEDVNQGGLSCTVVAQNRHQFVWFNLQTQCLDSFHSIL